MKEGTQQKKKGETEREKITECREIAGLYF